MAIVSFNRTIGLIALATLVVLHTVESAAWAAPASGTKPLPIIRMEASSELPDFPALAAADGERFSVERGRVWKGEPGKERWSWTADLGAATPIGAILQIIGDEQSFPSCTPMNYVWQTSLDGVKWNDLEGTRIAGERRMHRIHRLTQTASARYLRISIETCGEEPPALREVEIYSEPAAEISFPDWLLVISSHDKPILTTCHRYLDLAKKCEGWSDVTAQFLWHGYLDPEFVAVEPQPLCLLFGGSTLEWCQVDRQTWKGVERLLQEAKYPMWAACGGGQVFGLLEEYGADAPWDCPKCRDPQNPKSPMYGHIGVVDANVTTPCSNYTNNVYEIGPTLVRLVAKDAVFAGLSEEFVIPEYHCGQLEHLPEGWDLLVTNGAGGKTWMQCMKKRDTCIYAAQFHIEHQGTPEASRTILSNFLSEAVNWNERRHNQAATAEAISRADEQKLSQLDRGSDSH